MTHSSGDADPANRSVTGFVALVFLISTPFFVLGSWRGLSGLTGAELPTSALMVVCPAIVAAVLVRRREGGLRRWLRSGFRRPGSADAIWYVPATLLLPLVMVSAYLIMAWTGMPLPPDPDVAWSTLPLLVLVYLTGAVAEELGWSGYATDPLQRRWGALGAGLILGVVWAVWHIIPYWQLGHGSMWIFWQGLYSVGLRVILVWLYHNTGGGLVAPILGHASSNVAWALFPSSGSHYDPAVTGPIVLAVAALITVLWGPATLSATPLRGLRRRLRSNGQTSGPSRSDTTV